MCIRDRAGDDLRLLSGAGLWVAGHRGPVVGPQMTASHACDTDSLTIFQRVTGHVQGFVNLFPQITPPFCTAWPVSYTHLDVYKRQVYAGCLNKAMRAAVPDLDAALARGDTSGATGWLRENLQRHGGLRTPRDTIAHACGFEPSEGPLLDYLEAKFRDLYAL